MNPAPPPPPPPRKQPGLPLVQLVNHLARALKATRFYAPDHAVVGGMLDEVQRALDTMLAEGPFTLGDAGSTLSYEGGPLESTAIREVASMVASTLYQRGVVALRFEPGLRRDELGALITALAAAPDEVRARGGVLGQLALSGITNLAAIEADEEVLRGDPAELERLAGGDPVAQQALQRARELEQARAAPDQPAASDPAAPEAAAAGPAAADAAGSRTAAAGAALPAATAAAAPAARQSYRGAAALALADPGFPAVPYRESLQRLKAAAQFARARTDPPGAGLAIGLGALLADAAPLATARFAAAAWVKLARQPEGLDGLERPGHQLIEWLEDNQDFAAAVKLAFSLAEACERARPPRRELIHQLFSGAAGVARAERLLVDGAPARPWIATALEPLVFHGAKAAVRARLVAALSAQGEGVLPRLRARFDSASPAALSLALEIAANISAPKTLPLCRELVRQGSREAKLVAVRALARLAADPGAVKLLATISGAEGDKPAAAAVRLEGSKATAELRALQREAVVSLGQIRSEAAVTPLSAALLRTALFGDKDLEPIRLAAAGALGDLYAAGVGGTRTALERGAAAAKGKARELCTQALEKKP